MRNPFRKETRSTDQQVTPLLFSLTNTNYLTDFQGEPALQQSDIFTAVRIIAGDISSAQIEVTSNDYLSDMLNKKANSSTTAYNFRFALFANLLLNGDSFALIERDNKGNVTGLRNVLPSQVLVMQDDAGVELGYQVSLEDGRNIKADYKDMIHLKSFTLDSKIGVNPLGSLKPELNMLKNGNNLLASFFQRGISLGGILKLKDSSLDNKAKKEIRKSFEDANAGAQNAGSVLVMDSTQEFEQLEMNTEVLKLIQNNKYSTSQIAKVFGIPISRFGQELVNTSESKADTIYINSTLNMYTEMLRQELEVKLGIDTSFDFSILKGEDKQSLFTQMMKKNNCSGILTINEVRKYYGYSEISGGDEVYQNTASQPLSQLKEGE